jgi:hypothetical protein
MPELQVTYEPRPIPWMIHRDHLGKQTRPGSAEVTLTVSAVDANSGAAVSGSVVSNPSSDPLGLTDDPNALNLQTNTPQQVRLLQVTSDEVPPGQPPLYLAPSVQISADGYEPAFLTLD